MKSQIVKKITLLFSCMFFLLLFSSNLLFAENLDFSFSAETKVGAFLPSSKFSGKFSEVKEKLNFSLESRFENANIYVSTDFLFNALSAIENNSENEMAGFSFSLKEAWFDWMSPSFLCDLQIGFKLGRQITSWGKADGIRLVDVLCPQNLTTLNTSNYSESRLGVDALKLTFSGNVFSLDAYWIPIFRPSLLPLEKSNPLRQVLIPSSVILLDLEKKEISFENSSFATRLSFWFPLIDFSFYGYYGFDDSPVLQYSVLKDASLNPLGIKVSGKYFRNTMIGFDAAIPIGSFVLRGECGAFLNRTFPTSLYSQLSGEKSTLKKNQIMALVGFDFISNGWTITGQYYEDVILDYDKKIDRKKRVNGTTLSVGKSFLGETLEVSLKDIILWNDFDNALSAKCKYSLSDQITLAFEVTAFLCGPKNDGEYGKYKDLSSATISGVYRF